MKPHVHLTKKVKNFILKKMCEGIPIYQIAKRWPDKVPLARTIYTKAYRDPAFESMLTQGYTVIIYRRVDELHQLAGQLQSSSVSDWKQSEAALKRKVDEMKWYIGNRIQKIQKRCENIQLAKHVVPHIITRDYKPDLHSEATEH